MKIPVAGDDLFLRQEVLNQENRSHFRRALQRYFDNIKAIFFEDCAVRHYDFVHGRIVVHIISPPFLSFHLIKLYVIYKQRTRWEIGQSHELVNYL